MSSIAVKPVPRNVAELFEPFRRRHVASQRRARRALHVIREREHATAIVGPRAFCCSGRMRRSSSSRSRRYCTARCSVIGTRGFRRVQRLGTRQVRGIRPGRAGLVPRVAPPPRRPLPAPMRHPRPAARRPQHDSHDQSNSFHFASFVCAMASRPANTGHPAPRIARARGYGSCRHHHQPVGAGFRAPCFACAAEHLPDIGIGAIGNMAFEFFRRRIEADDRVDAPVGQPDAVAVVDPDGIRARARRATSIRARIRVRVVLPTCPVFQ